MSGDSAIGDLLGIDGSSRRVSRERYRELRSLTVRGAPCLPYVWMEASAAGDVQPVVRAQLRTFGGGWLGCWLSGRDFWTAEVGAEALGESVFGVGHGPPVTSPP